MKRTFKKRAMAMGMAAVMSVGSAAAMDTTSIQAAVKNLDKASATKSLVVGVGYKKQISVKNVPKSTTVTYTAKNKKIVSVDKKGKVKGKKAGSTYVTLKLKYKKKTVTKKCKVTVKTAVKSVKVAKKTVSLKVGGTYQTKVTVAPAKAYKKVTYTSSNKGIATVSEKGLVKAKKAGTTKITVKAQDGSGKSVKFTVNVKKATVKPTATPKATEPVNTPSVTESAKPTVAPTETPSVTADTKPTSVPATEVPPTAEPTTAPTATPAEVTKTITGADVKDGKVVVTGEYDNLVIEASVGNAEVTLDKTVVRNKLTMNGNADYTVLVKDAQIANAEVVEEHPVVQVSVANISRFIRFALGKRPTLHVQGSTVITNIHVGADVQLVGENTGKVENIFIVKESNVAISAPVTSLKVEQTAKSTNIMVASEVAKLDVVAPSAVISIAGAGKVNDIAVDKKAEGAVLNVSGQVKNIKAEAKTTTVKVEKEAKVEAIQVGKEAEGTNVELAGTVTNVVAEAKTMTVKVEKEAKVEAIQVTKEAEGTKVELAGTVTNVVAEAKTMTVKVEKEAKVEAIKVEKEAEGTKLELAGTVTNVTTAADKTEVTIAEEAKVSNLETSGNSTSIQGSGTVEKVEIKGNDTVVEGIGADKLVVDKDASGTTVNDKEVSGGTETVVKPILKPGEGENTGGNTGDKPGDNTGDKPGDSGNTGDNTGGSTGDNTSGSTGGNTGGGSGSTTEKTELEKAKEALTAKISESENYLTEVKTGYAATGSAITGLATEIENAKVLVRSTTVTDATMVVTQTSDLADASEKVKGYIDNIDTNGPAPLAQKENVGIVYFENIGKGYKVLTPNSVKDSTLKDILVVAGSAQTEGYTVDIKEDDTAVTFTKQEGDKIEFQGTLKLIRYKEFGTDEQGDFTVSKVLPTEISAVHIVNSDGKYIVVIVNQDGSALEPAVIARSHSKEDTDAYVYSNVEEKKVIRVENVRDFTYKDYDYVIVSDTIEPLVSGDRTVDNKKYTVSIDGETITVGLPEDTTEVPTDSDKLNTMLGISSGEENVTYTTSVENETSGSKKIKIVKSAYGQEINSAEYTLVETKAGNQELSAFTVSVKTDVNDVYTVEEESGAFAVYGDNVASKTGELLDVKVTTEPEGTITDLEVIGSDHDSISIQYTISEVQYIQNLPLTWVEVPSSDELTAELKSDATNIKQVDTSEDNVISLELSNGAAISDANSFVGKNAGEEDSHIKLTYADSKLTVRYETEKGTLVNNLEKQYTVETKTVSTLTADKFAFTKATEAQAGIYAVEVEDDSKVVIYRNAEETEIADSDISKEDVTVDSSSVVADSITVLNNSDGTKQLKINYTSKDVDYVAYLNYDYVTVPNKNALAIALAKEDTFTSLEIKDSTDTDCDGVISLLTKNGDATVSGDSLENFKGTINGEDDADHTEITYDSASETLKVTYTTKGDTPLDISKTYKVEITVISELGATAYTFEDADSNDGIFAVENEDNTIAIYRDSDETPLTKDDVTVSISEKTEATIEDVSVTDGTKLTITYTFEGKTYVETLTCKYVNVPSVDDLSVGLADSETLTLGKLVDTASEKVISLEASDTVEIKNDTFEGKIGEDTDSDHTKLVYNPDNKELTVTYQTKGGTEITSISKTYKVELKTVSQLESSAFDITKSENNPDAAILAVEKDSETNDIVIYRNDTKKAVSADDLAVKVTISEGDVVDGTITDISDTTEGKTMKVTYEKDDVTYVTTLNYNYVDVPKEGTDLEVGLADAADENITVLTGSGSENDKLLVNQSGSLDESSFEIKDDQSGTNWSDYVVISYDESEDSVKTGNVTVNFYTKGTKPEEQGTTGTEEPKALYTFTKTYFVYNESKDSNVVAVTKATNASENIANVIQAENGSIKVYCITDDTVTADELASAGNSVVLSEEKDKVYLLSDDGEYVAYGVTVLTETDSISGVTLSKTENNQKNIAIDDEKKNITYSKKNSVVETLEKTDFEAKTEGTVQLVSDDTGKVTAVYVEKESSYVVYTVEYVVLPEDSTLEYADFAFGFDKEKTEDLRAIEAEQVASNDDEDEMVDVLSFYIDEGSKLNLTEAEGLTVTVTTDKSEQTPSTVQGTITWVDGGKQLKVTYTVEETDYEKTLDYQIVSVPATATLGADVTADNTGVVYYAKETPAEGNEKFIILKESGTVSKDDFQCGVVSEQDGIAEDETHIVKSYEANVLTVNYYKANDLTEGEPSEDAEPLVSKTYDVEVITKAQDAPDAEGVSLGAKEGSSVISSAEIKTDGEGNVITVTLATEEEAASPTLANITAADFTVGDNYTVYVDASEEGAKLYLVSTGDDTKTYTEYSIVETDED